jgi:L-tartrate/succinate antiporter
VVEEEIKIIMKSSIWRAALPLLVGLSIALLPPPQGLDQNAWFYFALFVSVILGLILEPIPSAAI